MDLPYRAPCSGPGRWAALERGINFIGTAPLYGFGRSEDVSAAWITASVLLSGVRPVTAIRHVFSPRPNCQR
ncbi:hypothetical protein PUN4_570118 [Paraburkholderia unamae]|nr:hypothetical protein PUN4_570118 [Paraburkholderia unamae]